MSVTIIFRSASGISRWMTSSMCRFSSSVFSMRFPDAARTLMTI
jgi:hypothetical protein